MIYTAAGERAPRGRAESVSLYLGCSAAASPRSQEESGGASLSAFASSANTSSF